MLHRRKPKAVRMMDRLAIQGEYNFYFPRDVGRKFLEELPATIVYSAIYSQRKSSPHPKDIHTMCERLLTTDNNKEYYIGIKQSNTLWQLSDLPSLMISIIHPFQSFDFSLRCEVHAMQSIPPAYHNCGRLC